MGLVLAAVLALVAAGTHEAGSVAVVEDSVTEDMLIRGDARSLPLLNNSVDCVVTSPPYFGLRDYGTATWDGGDEDCDHRQGRPGAGRADGIVDDRAQRNRDGVGSMGGDCQKCGAQRIDKQLGLEASPAAYLAALVAVFREVWRVLKPQGTMWLNIGDSYAGQSPSQRPSASALSAQLPHSPSYPSPSSSDAPHSSHGGSSSLSSSTGRYGAYASLSTGPLSTFKQGARNGHRRSRPRGYEELAGKQLLMIPARVALALQADGWYLRSDIIWSKPNPMPESVTDRPTKAHEYLFLLSKSERYYYDADAIREAWTCDRDDMREKGVRTGLAYLGGAFNNSVKDGQRGDGQRTEGESPLGRNKRSVWTIPTMPYAGAHFATMPEALVEPCILAGCPLNGLVLDPFVGSGTVVAVAERLGRRGVGVDLSYQDLAKVRTAQRGLRFDEATA